MVNSAEEAYYPMGLFCVINWFGFFRIRQIYTNIIRMKYFMVQIARLKANVLLCLEYEETPDALHFSGNTSSFYSCPFRSPFTDSAADPDAAADT